MEKRSLSEKKYTRYIGYSLTLHVLLVALFYLFSFFHKPVALQEKEILWVQLGGMTGKEEGLPIKESKTLPKTTIKEQKQATSEQPSPKHIKEEVKSKTEPKRIEKEKLALQEKLKKKKNEEKKETKKEEVKKPVEDSRIKNALAKINDDLKEKTATPEAAQAKTGGVGDPTGTPEKGGANSECGRYSSQIRQKIVSNWIRLVGSNRPPRPPKISVMINASGEIISTPQWIQKSGDYSLDSSTLRAVQTASPFPPPPVNCQEAVREGFVVVFGK